MKLTNFFEKASFKMNILNAYQEIWSFRVSKGKISHMMALQNSISFLHLIYSLDFADW